jgi:hypothetical protein
VNEPKIKDCLNGCGPLVFLERPAWVLNDLDYLAALPDVLRKSTIVCKLILAVCPKCGYLVSRELKQAEWKEFLKTVKPIKGAAS